MADLSEVGINFSTYLASLSPQIKNNSLQWYLSGSLATIMMAGAESITEIELDEENNTFSFVANDKSVDGYTLRRGVKFKVVV